ncbi:hypothetical protein HPP92_003513 [Vanilla planifolia]|uniref:Peptide-methionine (R)-S-oxide reductase n=1 Tax=Vanilla planifolia TaxID=51239 RepID=A0A835VNQ4_VANPL|nr:hypothetical protein HPP92_003513 [Vanilla planifolia]
MATRLLPSAVRLPSPLIVTCGIRSPLAWARKKVRPRPASCFPSFRAMGASSSSQKPEQTQGKGDYASLSDDEWKKRLTPEQFYVTRQKGTERAFTGEYWNTKTLGTYHCVCCDTPLFESKSKFDSGTGWPSYYESIGNNVKSKLDMSIVFMPRTEVICAACNAHLGHVFDDGPPPTGKRYCINRGNRGYDEDDKGESVGKGIRVMEEKVNMLVDGKNAMSIKE